MASLEVGFSHDIFVEWAIEAKNLILFTERGQVLFSCLILNFVKNSLVYYFGPSAFILCYLLKVYLLAFVIGEISP